MNRQLIAERCRAGGLSIHKLAQQAWIDPYILWDTPAEPGDDRIPLGTLRTLSRLLDLDLEELVRGPTTPPQTPGDDIRIEAALAEPPGSFTRDDLAGALEWTLQRVDQALNALEERLQPTGRRLRTIGWHRYTLGPNLAILTAPERARLNRTTTNRLARKEYQTLYQIFYGWNRPAFRLADERASLDTLTTHGLINTDRRRIELSADVAFSLRLDDADHPTLGATDTPMAQPLTPSWRIH